MNRRLKLVDDKYLAERRAYVAWLGDDDEEFANSVLNLETKGVVLINGDENRNIDEVDMRLHLQCLAIADDLILSPTWWTNATAHKLANIAGWAGVRFSSPTGEHIEVTSMGGRR